MKKLFRIVGQFLRSFKPIDSRDREDFLWEEITSKMEDDWTEKDYRRSLNRIKRKRFFRKFKLVMIIMIILIVFGTWIYFSI